VVSALEPDARVVVLPGSVATSYAGSLLAGVRADVVAVEPPGGSRLRADPALSAAVAAGTSSRVVDPYDTGALDPAVAGADLVLVGSDGPHGADRAADQMRADPTTPSSVVDWACRTLSSPPCARRG